MPCSFEVWTTRGQNNSDKAAQIAYIEHEKLFIGIQKGRPEILDGDFDREANLAVLRPTNCPSYLFEGEFIHTPHGEALILDPAMRELMALAQARAICIFLDIDPSRIETDLSEPIDEKPMSLEERVARLEGAVFPK